MNIELTIPHALKLLNSNKQHEAKDVLEKILDYDTKNTQARHLLVKYAFANKDYPLAEKHLLALLEQHPLNDSYINPLIELYCFQKKWKDAASIYLKIAKKQPNNATVQYNCAYYLKLAGEFNQAIAFYNHALKIGIDQDYEVYLNIAVIYSEHLSEPDKAINILTSAINKYPNQDSLLYNLANIYEQMGNKEKALSLFKLAFNKNPQNYNALARQADIYQIENSNDDLICQIKTVLDSNKLKDVDKIDLSYALGKAYDDCKEYSLAFNYYQNANDFNKKTLPSYDPRAYEAHINNIITTFSKDWFESFEAPVLTKFDLPPIFICGMFRSGSTLCEQILAGHSQVRVGGEQEFFHRTVTTSYPNYPNNVLEKLNDDKDELLKKYMNEITNSQPNTFQLTDKRPDNFLYLGLIKALMPNAKIIWTKRDILDNCLSVYFLRLGPTMSYSTELKNIIHFYKQQEKLMDHWRTLFNDIIYEFNYDALIDSPEEQIKELLSFTKLKWEDNCLNFHTVKNQVKTASVWQVRQPLYKKSSGRWENYKQNLENIGLLVDEK
jgi:tetratricopeptide (TPR) repeat protein